MSDQKKKNKNSSQHHSIKNKKTKEQKPIKSKSTTLSAADPNQSSNASNYRNPLGYQVDPRTGNLQVSIAPPALAGFFGPSITPAIYYTQQSMASGNRMLGLPLGWAYHFSFISGSRIFINGQSSYAIDSNYDSGMRYYNLKNVVFKPYGAPVPFPYDKTLSYTNALHFYNGETQYFDNNGRLVGIDDRFGNHVTFYYDVDEDVYRSRISKIVDSYGQETTFAYSSTEITISYPKNGFNRIFCTYLMDEDKYLIGYCDPTGQLTTLVNKGGLAKNNLISQISNPNGLVVNYTYSTLRYYADPSKSQFSRLDCVATVQEVYASETRTVSYNYDPTENAHNFMGYPTYNVSPTEDTLLQSYNNTYRYSTKVNDGIFVTEHIYNNLHLELETKVFTADIASTLVAHTVNMYKSETEDQYFPHYYDLPPNYQTPIKVITELYNDAGQVRTHQVETDFDECGNPTEVRSYQKDLTTGSLTLMTVEATTYYDYEKYYGQVAQKDLSDYTQGPTPQPGPTIRRSINTLTADNKNIGTSISGFAVSGNFEPFKKSSFNYDSLGRIILEKLEWDDGQEHALMSTQSSTTYSTSCPVQTITNINAQNQATVTQTDTTTGWMISQTDPLGNSVKYTYDNMGRKLTATDPLCVETKWIYDLSNNKVTTQHANGYQTYVYTDGFGNQIRTSDNMGPGGTERVLSTKTYNSIGQLIQEEGILGTNSRIVYTYDNRGQVSTVTDALGNMTRCTYDPVAQTKTEYFNNNKISEVASNTPITTAKIYSTTDPNQTVTTTTYSNAYNKVVYQLLGDKSSNTWAETDYLYDPDLNVSSYRTNASDGILGNRSYQRDLFANSLLETINVTLPDNTTSSTKSDSFTYNNLSQLIEECNALSQNYECTYNANGMQVTYTDHAGTLFTSTYNVNNQVTSVSYQDKAGKTHEKKFSYEPLTSQLHAIESFLEEISQGSVSYAYTLDNQLASLTYPDGKQVSLHYDNPKGVLSQSIDALGQVTKYTYDDYGRMIGLQRVGTSYSVNFAYYTKQEDPANSGKTKSVATSNGVVKSYIYNGFGAVETVTVTDTNLKTGGNILLKMIYSYNPTTKNIIRIAYSSTVSPQDPSLNYTTEYTYNSLNQLITERVLDPTNKVLSTKNYTYDAANNVTTESVIDGGEQSTTTYHYDADNKLTAITTAAGTTQLTYDVNGNLIDDGAGSVFTYDENNNLVGYQNKETNIQATYTYYPNGLRATKQTTDSDLIQFYYDGATNPNIINEVQSSTSTSYVGMGSERYIRLVQSSGQSIPQYFIDNLKDTIGLLNGSNTFEDTYVYDPYGKQVNSSSDFTILNINDNPFKYTGEYTDLESGLIYLRARYYNSRIKQFMSRDTAMLINRYVYADGNPIMNTDPSGHFSWEAFGAILGGVVAIVGAVALTVATAGAAAPTIVAASAGAGALIGAGASSTIYGATHTSNFDGGDYGIMVGLGAGFGAAGGVGAAGIGGAVGSAAASAGWSAGRTLAVTLAADVAFNTGLGATDGYVTNGSINANHGVGFDEGGGTAAGYGALFGGVTSGTLGLFGRGVAMTNSSLLRGDLMMVMRGRIINGMEVEVGLSSKWNLVSHSKIRIDTEVYHSVPTGRNWDGRFSSLLRSTLTRDKPLQTTLLKSNSTTVTGGVRVKVPVRNGAQGMNFLDRRVALGDNLGDYNFFTNSCTSNVVDGLQAIGFRVPIFARSPWLLNTWFRGLRFSGPA